LACEVKRRIRVFRKEPGTDGKHSPPVEGWHFAQQNDGVVTDARETTPPLRGTPPREGNYGTTIPRNGMQPWSAYIIEPPDILNVEAIDLVPKAPYKLRTFDVVQLNVVGTPPDDPITGLFALEPGGDIQLGGVYGSVKIGGMSTDEVQEVVTKHLESGGITDPIVSVKLARMGDMQQIVGNHTVGPDGYITLRSYGRVKVNGLTVDESRDAIVFHLSKYLENPQVIVKVEMMASKKYYVVLKGAKFGERVIMFPCKGSDTVMDAIANMEGLVDTECSIKHVRPRENGEPVVTPLTWEKVIFSKSGFGDNLQLLPGDRLVLEMKE
jgi:protein involved in polysaccharide export with SLBB domain